MDLQRTYEGKGRPAIVSQTKQVGEARWNWVEPAVWTERMLTALVEGVKGGKWFSLVDKHSSIRNLKAAFEQVRSRGGRAGVDHQTIEMFESNLESNLEQISRRLKEGSYQPKAVKRVMIPKTGSKELRPLGIPSVMDRVVQAALVNVLEPIFEGTFAEHSYGFRPKRGCKDALRRVDQLLNAGYAWVVDADLKSYFDTIPHERLMKLVEERVSDGRVLDLIRAYLKQEIMDGLKLWTPEGGTPQGAVLSPLLSNIYLNPLDHELEQRGIEMVRYADDLVLLCRSREEAEGALEILRDWVIKAELQLHPEKTRIVDHNVGGFDFLGYRFTKGRRYVRKKSLKKFRDAVRAKTKRTNGHSLEYIITDVNRTSVGWYNYFKHCYKTTLSDLDGWIRMRLRSILRKRLKLKGRGRGEDNRRWPNSFFARHGLFSLEAAHVRTVQSRKG